MCLPLNEIEAYLHYYAGRFQNNRFEHNELVNQAWIAINDLTIPEFASAGIRWAMQSYMDRQYRQDHRGKIGSVIQSIEDEIIEGVFLKDNFVGPKNKRNRDFENRDYVRYLLRNGNLSLSDRLLLDQRFYQEMRVRDIAKVHNCTVTNIHYRLRRIAGKLRKIGKVA